MPLATGDINSGSGEKVYNPTTIHVDNEGTSETGLRLNLYYFTDTTEIRPLVFAIHGGLFDSGDKNEFDENRTTYNDANTAEGNKRQFFTDLGYVYASIDYRLTINDDLDPSGASNHIYTSTNWTNRYKGDQALEDVADALKWLTSSTNAEAYGIDPTKIIIIGHAAGAFYASLLGTKNSLFSNSSVQMNYIRGVVMIDTTRFDLKDSMTAISSSTTDENDWKFMNAWGVHPSINTVDFADLSAAQTYWNQYSSATLAADTTRDTDEYAEAFLAISRGTTANQTAQSELTDELTTKGIYNKSLHYAGSISGTGTISGTVTYDTEGIHRVIGNSVKGDLPNNNTDLVATGNFNITTELLEFLEATKAPPLETTDPVKKVTPTKINYKYINLFAATKSLNLAKGPSLNRPDYLGVSVIPYEVRFKDRVGLFRNENYYLKVSLDIIGDVVLEAFEEDGWGAGSITLGPDNTPSYLDASIDYQADENDQNYEGSYFPDDGLPILGEEDYISVEVINRGVGNKFIDQNVDVSILTQEGEVHPHELMYITRKDHFYIAVHARNTRSLEYDIELRVGFQYRNIARIPDKRYIMKTSHRQSY